MMTTKLAIHTTEIKPYTYRTPSVQINQDGELEVLAAKNAIHIKKLTLINLVGRDTKGELVSFEPLDIANRFLMAHHIELGKQESDQYSKGLVHYFSFLIRLQEQWDYEYDEDLFDELTDHPRPTWDYMALRKSERITYLYRTALKNLVTKETDPKRQLARTTATAYMNAVIKFYSYHLRNGYQFNNPPFEHEVLTIHFESTGQSMKPYMSKEVHTTDLRLNFPKSKRNQGGALPSSRRDLKPLSNIEWKAVENILVNTQHVIKLIDGEYQTARFAIEYCLFFLICRFTGLRKEEVASLHLGQICKPDLSKPMLRLGVGDDYGSLTKSKDGGNKSRKTIIPSKTMQLLYDYSRSERYRKRLGKFKAVCKQKRIDGDDAFFDSVDGVDENKQYLFLSQTGKPFFTKLNEVNTRWNEIRKTVEHTCGINIDGTPHNLRSTFAVSLFRALLRVTKPDIALALVSDCLGHDDEATTLLYLKIAQNEPTGDEIYEDVLDFIGVFDIPESSELTHD